MGIGRGAWGVVVGRGSLLSNVDPPMVVDGGGGISFTSWMERTYEMGSRGGNCGLWF